MKIQDYYCVRACANNLCPKNTWNAPNGIAVTARDIAECPAFLPITKPALIATSAGEIRVETYDDGCAKGLHVLLNESIVCSLDVYEPENDADEGEARVLVYRKEYAEDEEEAPIAITSINRN